MNSTDYAYDIANNPAGVPTTVAIYGARQRMRDEIAGDLAGAGFRTLDGGGLVALTDLASTGAPLAMLGDVVVVDCPALDAAAMAGLARLDERAAFCGARVVVSTSLDALDDVFGLLDQSAPQILIAPSRAERVLAVGRACSEAGIARLRDMSEEERLTLLKLSNQVDAIARSLDRNSDPQGEWGAPSRGDDIALGEAKPEYRGAGFASFGTAGRKPGFGAAGFGAKGGGDPALPHPTLIRQIIANRQKRTRFFDASLFADPAWDMLLDLAAARAEGGRVSVTSLCIAAGVPATTALRWLTQMAETGALRRAADPADKRRVFIELSDTAAAGMVDYFAAIEHPAAMAV